MFMMYEQTKHTKISICHLEDSLNIMEELTEDDAFEPSRLKPSKLNQTRTTDIGQVPVKIETIKTNTDLLMHLRPLF